MEARWPSREIRLSRCMEQRSYGVNLLPGLTWKAMAGLLRRVARDESVGYGWSWTVRRPSQLAVIQVGYVDGYSRDLSDRSGGLIRGRSVPDVGRVGANNLIADVNDIPDDSIGEEVVLIGRLGDDEVPVEEFASLSDLINDEILARRPPAISLPAA